MSTDPGTTWEGLPPFEGSIAGDEQVVVVAMKGGAKSTLVASLTLDVPSLIAIDDKGRMTLPHAIVYDLPPYDRGKVAEYDAAVAAAIAWQKSRRRLFGSPAPVTDRIILRPDPLDADMLEPHDRIFRAVYLHRPDTLLWIDEISATGATPHTTPRYLRALSARGRTRGIGMWTASQAAYGLVPPILIRNAGVLIVGPIPPRDAKDVERDGWQGADLAASLPTHTGRFIAWRQGDNQPYRLYVPIPPKLARWQSP